MSIAKGVLVKAVKLHLLKNMNEVGFEFNEKQLKFKRKQNDFSQELWFVGNRYNSSESIYFTYNFAILNKSYRKFKKTIGEKIHSTSGLVIGNRDAFQKLNRSKESGPGYNFLKIEHDVIMDDVFQNFINVGLEYFSENDTHDKIVQHGQGIEQIDFQILNGSYKKVRNIYNELMDNYVKMQESEKIRSRDLMNLWKRKIKYIDEIE